MRRLVTAISATILAFLPATLAGAAADGRSYVSGYFALDLDGVKTGFLKSVEGGGVTAEVLTYQEGSSPDVVKLLGRRTFEGLSLEAGLGMDPAFYDWIGGTFAGKPTRRDGSIVTTDLDLKTMSRRTFADALISEIQIPDLDTSSKDPAFMTVRLVPESAGFSAGDGAAFTGQTPPTKKEQKQWMASNFRLRLGDLPCEKVNKIEAFTLKQKVIEYREGNDDRTRHEPGGLEIPNLVVSVPPRDAKAWIDWHEQFVVQHHDGPSDELEGSLTFLDRQGADLARIDLHHVGVFAISLVMPGPDDKTAGPNAFYRVVVSLYVEGMTFTSLGGSK